MEDYTEFLGKYGQMLCQFFAFGALEAEIGMWISTLVNHRYMAWLAPFMSEYLLIILCERYFPECRVFYPPDWLVVQADWPLHGWSVFFLAFVSDRDCRICFCGCSEKENRICVGSAE